MRKNRNWKTRNRSWQLAWRAINSSLPKKKIFPHYELFQKLQSLTAPHLWQLFVELLSLMDAGVPIEPVAGIAMGLIKEKRLSA